MMGARGRMCGANMNKVAADVSQTNQSCEKCMKRRWRETVRRQIQETSTNHLIMIIKIQIFSETKYTPLIL